MKYISLFLLFAFALLATPSLAQDPANVKAEAEAYYQDRISREYLDRIYIPKDIADAFIQLNDLIDDESKKKFLSVDENEAARKLHFSLGRWMMRNWGFYEGSRLSHYLRNLGISYPDDMARFIILTYHRNLRKQPLDVKPLIEGFIQKREEDFKSRIEKGEIIHEEKRKRNSVNPEKQ
ncbi:MAG: hypothetical protein HKN16_11000 [Saprospiraceae bacterium]|nr:hypothetical protein [Saprospiraceae bacterium]